MKRPTNRMNEYLEAIKKFMQENGYSPTIRELGAMLGLTSTSTIQNMLTRMREKGLIDFVDYQSRTITLMNKGTITISREGYEIPSNDFIQKVLYKKRMDKAIEFIKENCLTFTEWKEVVIGSSRYIQPKGKIKYKALSKNKVKELLEILKGEDNVKD